MKYPPKKISIKRRKEAMSRASCPFISSPIELFSRVN